MGNITISTRVLKNGKVVYEYKFEIASVNGQRKWKTKSGFKTKKEAREAGKIAQQNYEQVGQVVDVSGMSFADFLDEWIEMHCKLVCKEETVRGYKKKIRLYIKPELGGYKLKAITKNVLQSFIVKMYDDGFSLNTISSVKGILSNSFRFAVDRHYINESPAIRLLTPTNLQPKVATRQKQHVYIEQDRIEQIFNRFPVTSTSYIPLQIAYHTGLRLGEVFGLVWADVSFDKKTLAVNRQVQWHQADRTEQEKHRTNGTSESGGYWYFTPPKYKSYRVIDLDDTILTILKEEYEKQEKSAEYYAEYYTRYYTTSELQYDGVAPTKYIKSVDPITNIVSKFEVNFICRRENGTYVSPRTMQHVSSIIHRQLNFPEFDMHSFRHTHATMLIENGADMIYVQRRLGHKDIQITMNVYANHITEKIRDRNTDKLNNMF